MLDVVTQVLEPVWVLTATTIRLPAVTELVRAFEHVDPEGFVQMVTDCINFAGCLLSTVTPSDPELAEFCESPG